MIAGLPLDCSLRQAIDMRRLHAGSAVATDIAIAEIVGIDEDDVRSRRFGRTCLGGNRQKNQNENVL